MLDVVAHFGNAVNKRWRVTATIWVSLASAVIAVSGVIFTQFRADRRAMRERLDQRTHEKALWLREDMARTYEQRRDSYLEFMQQYDSYERAEQEKDFPDYRPVDPEDFRNFYDAFEKVAIFGTLEAGRAAKGVLTEMEARLLADSEPDLGPITRFRNVVRKDLGVPDEVIPLDS